MQGRQEMDCRENRLSLGDLELCWFEWGRPGQGRPGQGHPGQGRPEERDPGEKTILLVHATGFHARCWDRTVSYLGDRHVIALDMRGHGRSDKCPPYTWDVFGTDLAAFTEALDLHNVVGVGHSMGGHSVVQAAASQTDRFSSLLLVDPVILAPDFYTAAIPEHHRWLDESGQHPVARRRNHFDDAEAMMENFRGRGSYGLWQEEVLRDYCRWGLVPAPEGSGYVLACPPEVEAAIYMGSAGTDIYEAIGNIAIPVGVMRARGRESDRGEMDFSRSPTWDQLAARFPQGVDLYHPELTHFMPMQAPELVARYIREFST